MIGVYRYLRPLASAFLGESHILLPYNSGTFALRDGAPNVYLKTRTDRMGYALQDARTILVAHLKDEACFQTKTSLEQSNRQMSQVRKLSALLAIFGFVALNVSAIGVQGITLISIHERTREIGLRRTLGALKRMIIWHILGESLLYTVFGALVGIFMASLSAQRLSLPFVTELFFGQEIGSWKFSWLAGVYAFLLASMATLFVSLYPALQSAKIPPIEALREL